MKRTVLFVLSVFVAFITLNAQTVSVEDALSKAVSLNNSGRHRAPAAGGVSQTPQLAYTRTDNGNTLFYVFNYPQGGFAIIGGDECANEILGYSTNGAFNIDSIPEGLKDMLGLYSSQISYAIDNTVVTSSAAKAMRKVTAKTAIAPLMSTKWNQTAPYNNAIPSLGSNYEDLVTGCNATAAAQVMKFYKYPTKGEGSNSYSKSWGDGNDGTITLTFSADFANTTYDWDNMLDEYGGSDTGVEADAVATLLYHVGVGMNMDYGQASRGGSSSSTKAPGTALTQYFKYSKSAKYEQRDYYSDTDWEDLVYSELQKHHPVLYGGQSTSGGHAFVCHGYDASQGGFLINWGWGGYCDGYFPLTGTGALQPTGSGTGGAGEGAAYTTSQGAFIGLVPDEDGDDEYLPQIAINNEIPFSTDDSYSITLDRSTGSSADKTVSLTSVGFCNVGYLSSTFNYGLMFEEQSTGLVYYSNSGSQTLTLAAGGYYFANSFPLTFNTTSIPYNGTYTIRPVVRNSTSSSDEDWQLAYIPNTYTLPEITVSGGENAKPVDITFKISANEVEVSKTLQITHNNGYSGTINYSSSDESIASVDADGVITAHKVGTVIITAKGDATTVFNETAKTFTVNVVDKIMRDVEFKISETALSVGETATITYTSDYNGTPSYKSDNTSVATVDAEGNVKAIAAGSTTITVTAPQTNDYNAATTTFKVYVIPEGFVFTEEPYFNTANLVSADEYKIHCAVKNNTSSTLSYPGVYYKFTAGNGTYGSGYYYYSIPAGYEVEFDLDLSGYLSLFTPNTTYTVYFYSDSSRTVPMNIPSITFTYCTPGDADGSGTVDSSDINSIKNIIIGTTTASDVRCNSDLNYDGKVDIQDITILINKLKGN